MKLAAAIAAWFATTALCTALALAHIYGV